MPLAAITKFSSIGAFAVLLILPAASFAAPQDEGRWSALINWPVNARNSLLTPQGKVMSASSGQYNIWDPELGLGNESRITFASQSDRILFGSSLVLIPETGKVLIAGGGDVIDPESYLEIFDPQSNSIQQIADLKHDHSQPAMTVLPSGEILISNDFDTSRTTSTVKINEVFSPASNQTRSLMTASDSSFINGNGFNRPSRQWVTPMGKIAGVENTSRGRLFTYDVEAQSLQPIENSLEKFSSSSVEVMYQPGKILNINKSLALAFKLDINSATPWIVEKLTRPLTRPRNTSTMTVLPNGNVMIAGGMSRPEMWNPDTEEWSLLAEFADNARSGPSSMLLKDGRVMLASYEQSTVEIFSPPYLFNSAGQEAVRPIITSAPDRAAYGSEVTVQHQSVSGVSRVTLIKTGKSQHQRFMELDFEETAGGIKVKMPEYATVATPGYYLMYLLDGDGVPSKGHIIKISDSVQVGGAYPVAIADTGTSNGNAVTLNVLSNDTGTGLSLVEVNQYSEQGGTAKISANQIVFTPKAGFSGSDAFWYVMQDSQGRRNAAKVTLSIISGQSNPYPTTTQDNVTTTTATQVTIDVLANDTGSGLQLNAPNAWSLNGGTVSLISNKLLYTSRSGFTGNDNIWYTFKDSQGRSNSGQVNITVNSGASSAYPVANADYYSTAINTGKNLNILANDTGGSWRGIDTLYQYTAKGGSTYKTPEGQVWYIPKAGFSGEDNFWYVMVDSEGRKNSAQVKINVN